MGSWKHARVVGLVAAVMVSAASLVCGPVVTTTTQPQLQLEPAADTHEARPAAAVLAQGQAAAGAVAMAEAPPFVVPTGVEQWFEPSGRNMGTEGPAMFLAALALKDNPPLYISETHGRTTGGAQSDHHISRNDSWAVDVAVRGIQAPTPQTHLAAKRISTALGVKDWAGGDLTKTVGNYRIQVLWLVAGHYNHVHVGIRRIS
jgi:hypothetical protein